MHAKFVSRIHAKPRQECDKYILLSITLICCLKLREMNDLYLGSDNYDLKIEPRIVA